MATEPSDAERELRDQVRAWSQVGSAIDFEEQELALSPTDALEVEHRLIERVIRAVQRQAASLATRAEVDPVFVDRVVDFIATYAERVHQSKEEEILFRELDGKNLAAEQRQTLEELVREHVEMRRIVEDLAEAKERYVEGDEESLEEVADALNSLIHVYPEHMALEEDQFFPASVSYLDDSEQRAVLEEMRGHDVAMIHERYGALADELEGIVETWQLSE